MAKRKKIPRKAQQAAPAAQAKPAAAPNPFERLHSRKKFSILGKRARGEQRPTGKLRSEAVEKREKTLLVEYKQLRKANAFIDRRFGEDDDTLTAEEKAVARFQKERMKATGGDRFALGDVDGEELTHLGRSLAESSGFEGPACSESDDEGGAVDAEAVHELHFGGGFVRKGGAPAAASGAGAGAAEEGEPDPERRRSKKEVMEEVMAKSKAARSARQLQRAEDLDATDALDAQFASLVQQGGLEGLVRPKGARHERAAAAAAVAAQATEDAAFDRARRELVFEAKATVGERTRTAEELAEAEAQRLQALEAARQRRMRGAPAGAGGDDLDGDFEGDEDAGAPAGGYAARRHKRRRQEAAGPSGDALEDDFELSDGSGAGSDDDSGPGGSDDEGGQDGGGNRATAGMPLQARQAARAAGAHPLQQSLRAASAALLRKHGAAGAAAEPESGSGGEDEEDEEGSGEEDASEEAGSEEAGVSEEGLFEKDEKEEESNEEEGDDEEAEEPGQTAAAGAEVKPGGSAAGTAKPSGSRAAAAGAGGHEEAGSSEEEEEEENAEQSSEQEQKERELQARRASSHAASTAGKDVKAGSDPSKGTDVAALPYTLGLPASYEEFAALVAGRSAAELGAAVARIRACNAPALLSDGRRRLQEFYGVLVQHFALRAGAQPLPLGELDALTVHLLALTPEVPLYAATVARTRLQRLLERLTAALRGNPRSPDQGSAWPGARGLLLHKLWATLFPASDRRHAVLTPAALILGACLAMCPLARAADVAQGLFAASLALHLAAPAQRLAPEALTFAVRALRCATPDQAARPASARNPAPERDPAAPKWLLPAGGWGCADLGSGRGVPPLEVGAALATAPGDAYFGSDAFRASALAAAMALLVRAAQVFGKAAALPELLAPAARALRALGAAGLPQAQQSQDCFMQALEAQRRDALAALEAATAKAIAERRPLQRRGAASAALARAPVVKMYNPRFEEDFAAGRDYDPDRERAEQRRLKRQLQKEKRGAMRELRKDAAFIGGVRQAESAAAAAELRAGRRANFAILERQEADARSGGQGGMFKGRKRARK